MSVIPPFNRLLNTISHDIDGQNLRSLVHICSDYIPESRREEIKHGLDLFRILKQNNVIGDEHDKAENLLQIMRDMRPKRKDIIRKVKQFIRDRYDKDIESSVDSWKERAPPAVLVDNYRQPPQHVLYSSGIESGCDQSLGRSSSIVVKDPNNRCSMDCCCFGCNCYARQIPSCMLLITAVIMAIFTFLAILFWFDKIPKNLYVKLSTEAGKPKVGGYIVASFGFMTVVILVWWVFRKVSERHSSRIPYKTFENVNGSHIDVNGGVKETDNRIAIAESSSKPLPSAGPKKKRKRSSLGSVTTASSVTVAMPVPSQLPCVTSQQLSYPDSAPLKDLMEDGTQTDVPCASDETDNCASRESLFTIDSNYSNTEIQRTTAD